MVYITRYLIAGPRLRTRWGGAPTEPPAESPHERRAHDRDGQARVGNGGAGRKRLGLRVDGVSGGAARGVTGDSGCPGSGAVLPAMELDRRYVI